MTGVDESLNHEVDRATAHWLASGRGALAHVDAEPVERLVLAGSPGEMFEQGRELRWLEMRHVGDAAHPRDDIVRLGLSGIRNKGVPARVQQPPARAVASKFDRRKTVADESREA